MIIKFMDVNPIPCTSAGGCRNINLIVRYGLCTGCGTCSSACPTESIRMIKDDFEGLYFPRVEDIKCSRCGVCLRVCPGHSVDFNALNMRIFSQKSKHDLLGNYVESYVGYAKDPEIRYNSSSGGLITALLCFMLENHIIDGVLVTRMKKESPLEPEVILATSKDEVVSASGSKYCPVPLNEGLRKILDLSGKFAFVGLPCHIHGVRKFEGINEELGKKIIMHFGLFCANTVRFLGTEFFLKKLRVRKEDVKSIKYRGEGWPGKISIKLKNGKEIQFNRRPEKIIYRLIYSSSFHYDFMPSRCLYCPDQTNELADISFGDAWLPELLRTERKGVSLVMSRTIKGESLLKKAIDWKVVELTGIDKKTIERAQNYSYKGRFGSRIREMNSLGERTPYFLGKNLPRKVRVVDYLDCVIYLPSFFAAHRRLWIFLPYIGVIRLFASQILSILRKSERTR